MCYNVLVHDGYTPSVSHDPFLIDGHKAHFHMRRLIQAMDDPLHTYPIYVEVSPVGHCNHRCTFCAVDYIGYKPGSIDVHLFGERVHEMGRLGVKSIMFAGEGEPLLHKDIDTMVSLTYAAGIDSAFTTNGVLLEKLLPVMEQVKWIKVSCNAGDRETYAKVHQAKEKDWDAVWRNLTTARKVQSATTALGIQCVILPDNLHTLESLVQKAQEVGLDYVVFKPYSQHLSSDTRRYAELKYDRAVLEKLQTLQALSTPQTQVIARTKSISTWNTGAHNIQRCLSTPTLWGYIMATGDVYSCSAFLLQDKFNMGNINTHTFQEIWEGAKRAAHIEYMKTHDISTCRLNCRMSKVNEFLATVEQGNPHSAFL